MNLGSANITKKLKYGDRLNPARDWLILLGLFVIGLGVITVSSLIVFSRVTKGQQIGDATVNVPAQIELDQVKALFAARAAERARYDSQYRFIDPSK